MTSPEKSSKKSNLKPLHYAIMGTVLGAILSTGTLLSLKDKQRTPRKIDQGTEAILQELEKRRADTHDELVGACDELARMQTARLFDALKNPHLCDLPADNILMPLKDHEPCDSTRFGYDLRESQRVFREEYNKVCTQKKTKSDAGISL